MQEGDIFTRNEETKKVNPNFIIKGIKVLPEYSSPNTSKITIIIKLNEAINLSHIMNRN